MWQKHLHDAWQTGRRVVRDAWHGAVRVAGDIDHTMRFAKRLFSALSPAIEDVGGGALNKNMVQAFGHYDRGRDMWTLTSYADFYGDKLAEVRIDRARIGQMMPAQVIGARGITRTREQVPAVFRRSKLGICDQYAVRLEGLPRGWVVQELQGEGVL